MLPMAFCSCGGQNGENLSTNEGETTNDTLLCDSLSMYMQRLDSINNYSGSLLHLNIYKIGKLKSLEFEVFSVESEGVSVEYLNIKKDCGDEYYYDWENAKLLAEEIKYFNIAIDTILANIDRPVSNEERYVYLSKDDIRLISVNENKGGKWTTSLSVDYTKKNSSIYLSKDDFMTLKKILSQGEDKINELRNK